jgi:hypothetical protein
MERAFFSCKKIRNYRLLICLGLMFILGAYSSLQADTLDWQTETWTAGALSKTFTINGVNVTVQITGNTGNFITFSGVTAPDDSNIVDGGTGQEALYLGVDHSNRDTQSVTVTVTFSSAVIIGSFAIFDIDTFNTNSFQDQIRTISATDGTNTYYGNLTATNSTFVTVSNSGTVNAAFTAVLGAGGNGGAGNLTSDGTGTIDFGTNAITSLSFTYGNGSGAITNPTSQHVALGDFNYTVVPEPSTCLTGFLLVFVVSIHGWRQRRISQASRIA